MIVHITVEADVNVW